MVYGTGYSVAEDVDGHELTHGVTDFTSRLLYIYQSGAINESISDIMGEYIDQDFPVTPTASKKWILGDLVPGYPNGIRNMKDPTQSVQGAQPDRMTSPYYFAATSTWFSGTDNGGVHYNSGVANKAGYLMGEDPAVAAITFNGQTITPLGRDKAAAIWYEVEANLLTSGSDYADLGTDLQQACTSLTGTPILGIDGKAIASPLTAANCAQVAKVVAATEMERQPTSPQAAAPDAPVCTSGAKPVNKYLETVEYTDAELERGHSVGRRIGNPDTDVANWYVDANYATSVDPGRRRPRFLGAGDADSAHDISLAMENAVTVPANAFLRFSQSFVFDNGTEYDPPTTGRYDGGVVEYSTDNGTTWKDAGSLFTHNGYNGTVTTGGGNVLEGRRAFTASSNGYISSRLSLASLSGKNVKFRWRLGTDNWYGDFGWFLDDIEIYTCPKGSDATGPTVTRPAIHLASGTTLGTSSTPVPVKATFTASDPSGLGTTGLQHRVGTAAYASLALPSVTAVTGTVSVAASDSCNSVVPRRGHRRGRQRDDRARDHEPRAHPPGHGDNGGRADVHRRLDVAIEQQLLRRQGEVREHGRPKGEADAEQRHRLRLGHHQGQGPRQGGGVGRRREEGHRGPLSILDRIPPGGLRDRVPIGGQAHDRDPGPRHQERERNRQARRPGRLPGAHHLALASDCSAAPGRSRPGVTAGCRSGCQPSATSGWSATWVRSAGGIRSR